MIEDIELRNLFKAESGEQLERLEANLLRLEADALDREALEEAFRDAHSLKGAARMVGVRDVELIAHRVEDLLGSIRKGENVLSPENVDVVCKAIDAAKALVNEAVTGERAQVDIGGLFELPGGKGPHTVQGGPEPPAGREGTPQAVSAPGEASQAQTQTGKYLIETVRVDTHRLDELMAHAGELTVMRTRMEHGLVQVEGTLELWERLSKDIVPREEDKADRVLAQMRALAGMLYGLKVLTHENNAKLEYISGALGEGIRNMRLLPFSTIFSYLPRVARDAARVMSKEVNLVLEGEETTADKRIMEEMKDPLIHMVRNAIDHGIEAPPERERAGKPRQGLIRIKACRSEANITIEVRDDGRGLDMEAIKRTALKRRLLSEDNIENLTAAEVESLIFAPGFSTSAFVTDISGRGVGLDVVRTNIEQLKGTVQVESSLGQGCAIKVVLPLTLATARVMLVTVDEINYALPVESIETCRLISPESIFTVEGRQAVEIDGEPVSVVRLSDILRLKGGARAQVPSEGAAHQASIPCVIISALDERLGVLVDAMLDEQEVVLKQYSSILRRVPNVSGATILGNGDVCMVLNPQDIIRGVKKRVAMPILEKEAAIEERRLSILLVEDSITTRTQEKRILEGAGYEVTTAVDGVDALEKLSSREFDAVVSDVLMPNMDGLALTERIRKDRSLKDLPIVLVTTLASDEDKKRGLEAGANAYIPKPAFEQNLFLETLRRLI